MTTMTETAGWDNLRPRDHEDEGLNVGRTERWISGVAGAALLDPGVVDQDVHFVRCSCRWGPA